MYRRVKASLILSLTTIAAIAGCYAEVLTVKDAQQFFKDWQITHDGSPNLWPKFRALSPKATSYTMVEISAYLNPGSAEYDWPKERPQKKPDDAYTYREAKEYLAKARVVLGAKADLFQNLVKAAGVHEWYYPWEVQAAQETEGVPKYKVAIKRPEANPPIRFGFKVRQSWSDVMEIEDPSQEGDAKTPANIKGATVSYTFNGINNQSSWATVGSLIAPVEFRTELAGGFVPARFVLAPSFSVNWISNSAGPNSSQINNFLWRLGAFGEWHDVLSLPILQGRAAIVYGSDTNFQAKLPAFEIDIEPAVRLADYFPNLDWPIGLGFPQNLWPRVPMRKDGSDNSYLTYQLRAWMHIEGGYLQNSPTGWDTSDGSFFRLGPKLQLTLTAPLVYKGISVTAMYSYLPTTNRYFENSRNSLFDLSAAFILWADPGTGANVALKMQLIYGGLDLTKQNERTFLVGLSLAY